ncbi:type II toxin-antitoxin system RelE/ParE family toxin [Myxococcota bacterium]|nr:type II toxin-antitoxin system RelE/ParE family toxin [Myxococcota bacterium]
MAEPYRSRIAAVIEGLAVTPRPVGVKALQGALAGHYRLRVSDYRVLYKVENDVLIIVVVRVAHRREVYR